MSVILVIPDLHIPYHHRDAIHFLSSIKDYFKPDFVVNLGDEFDYHVLSFHDTDPDLPFSASSELEKSIEIIKDFYTLFPKCTVLESNHGSLVYRKSKYHGIPRHVIKTYAEIAQAPDGWIWKGEEKIENTIFRHQFSKNIKDAVRSHGCNVVQGHFHTDFKIEYFTQGGQNLFGASCGCLINEKTLAFDYAKANLAKPILGCLVIDHGLPLLIPMSLDKNGRWTGKI